MKNFERQNNLFSKNDLNHLGKDHNKEIYIDKKVIKAWQKKIIKYQHPIFEYGYEHINQPSLFESNTKELNVIFNPIKLTPLPLSFWRWPKTTHVGPAVYFVMDKIINTDENIILYIGETISAEKRWKGQHDCKNYLSNYVETLQKANVLTKLNIRFWLDVPIKTLERRELEQKLIQAWLPPFNKETREIR